MRFSIINDELARSKRDSKSTPALSAERQWFTLLANRPLKSIARDLSQTISAKFAQPSDTQTEEG